MNAQSLREPEAEKAAAPSGADNRMRAEETDWREMPFVELDGDMIVSNWAPAKIVAAESGKQHIDECMLGATYALRLLDHIREYAEFDTSEYLLDIAKVIIKRGELSGVEIGFFDELGRHISGGLSQIPLCSAAAADRQATTS